jgi:SAM-dependent methyltransferase
MLLRNTPGQMALCEMVLPIEAPNDKSAPAFNIARIRDYWLGGVHHTELDRKYADHIMVCAPQVPYLVREQRAMVRRMVRYLLECGVRQFLDLGSGVPTMSYVHEVAQAADPRARVVYVDIDPIVVRDGRELLRGNENAAYLEADVRRVDEVLARSHLLDLGRPVAVLMIETLLHIPDSDEPGAVVAGYVDALCPGSYLGISHFSATTELMNGFMLFAQMFGVPPVVTLREPEQVAEYFAGLELVAPGIVPLPLWRPDPGEDIQRNADRVRVPTGLGRKQ